MTQETDDKRAQRLAQARAFLAAYADNREEKTPSDEDDDDGRLPEINKGENVDKEKSP